MTRSLALVVVLVHVHVLGLAVVSAASSTASKRRGGGCMVSSPTCYLDDTTGKEHKRPLGDPTAVIGWTSKSMTQQLCAQRCANESMKLAGVEFADQCYCGNALNNPPVQPSSACTMSCAGASGEKCGGADAMLVFSVNCSGHPISPPPPSPAPAAPTEDFDWMDPCNLTTVTNWSVGFGWCNYSAEPKARAAALVAKMTLDEKARTMQPFAPPIPRLRLPPLWTTDALHGAFSSPHYSNCTVFPQAVANAASFDREYMRKMARVAADETRAKTNGEYGRFHSQDYLHSNVIWTPVVNLCRDARWGRCQETLGEDPYLTSELGATVVRSFQHGGLDEDKYLEVIATAKHFDVHGGPESASLDESGNLINTNRMSFKVNISKRDWITMHQPAFQATVEAGVTSVMCSYNEINGVPSCANKDLLTGLLRTTWNFTKDENFVVGDCGSVHQIYSAQHFNNSAEAAATAAVEAGVDWDCYGPYAAYSSAVNMGLLQESALDRAITRVLTAHVRLGFFDSPSMVAYKRLPPETINSPAHRELARWASSRVICLLKNKNATLPMDFTALPQTSHIAVIGPNADNIQALWGDYAGSSAAANVTAYQAAVAEVGEGRVKYAAGCSVKKPQQYNTALCTLDSGFDEAVAAARGARMILAVMGTVGAGSVNGIRTHPLEIEGKDRLNISLPGLQEQLLRQVRDAVPDVPLVVALMSGGAVSSPWVDANADAVLWLGFNGQFSGLGLFDVLSGRVSPGAKLPYTVPQSVDQLPVITNYAYHPQDPSAENFMGRTYRYLNLTTQEPLYPFGFGLPGYTKFQFSNLHVPISVGVCDPVSVTVTLSNVGRRSGSEVAQLYVTNEQPRFFGSPRWALAGFERIDLSAGETKVVRFSLAVLSRVEVRDGDYERVVSPSNYSIYVGGGQPRQPRERTPTNVLMATLTTTGDTTTLSACKALLLEDIHAHECAVVAATNATPRQ